MFIYWRHVKYLKLKLFILGRIKWVRSLHSHLEELVMEASSHPVLKTLPVTAELLRRYTIVSGALVNYEVEMKDMWMKQNVRNYYLVQ